MSEINCHGDEVIYSEVISGWHLVQLVNLAINRTDLPIEDRTRKYIVNGNVMGESDFGLTHTNDPTFIFSMPPMLEPKELFRKDIKNEFTAEAELYYKVLKHYHERLSSYVTTSYKFYLDCLQAGYNPENNPYLEHLATWLMPKIYHSWKKGKVMTYPYPNKDAVIHQPNLLEQFE